MTVDVHMDGRVLVTDDAGRTACLNADQWAYIQAQRLALRSQYARQIEENWYLQVLCFHVLSQNSASSAKK